MFLYKVVASLLWGVMFVSSTRGAVFAFLGQDSMRVRTYGFAAAIFLGMLVWTWVR